tara:strand:+ start:828 stop:1088 length:261 start_codon:yes stop_codon:yes gene_type:complete
MEVKYWRSYEKNTLKGFFSTQFDNGLIVKDMTYHIKGDNKWVGFPSKSYEQDKETKWTNICYFPDKTRGNSFQDAIIPLVEKAMSE